MIRKIYYGTYCVGKEIEDGCYNVYAIEGCGTLNIDKENDILSHYFDVNKGINKWYNLVLEKNDMCTNNGANLVLLFEKQ